MFRENDNTLHKISPTTTGLALLVLIIALYTRLCVVR